MLEHISFDQAFAWPIGLEFDTGIDLAILQLARQVPCSRAPSLQRQINHVNRVKRPTNHGCCMVLQCVLDRTILQRYFPLCDVCRCEICSVLYADLSVLGAPIFATADSK